jgi:hypothetical protein
LLRWGGFAIWAVVGVPVLFFEIAISRFKERAEQRGGTLSVETAPGRGFAVTAVFPLTGAAS